MGVLVAADEVTEMQLRSLHVGMTEIRGQLDKLIEAVSKLAVIEERQANVTSALERAFSSIKDQNDRIRVLEQSTPVHTSAAKWVDRGLLALAGAAAALFAKNTGAM